MTPLESSTLILAAYQAATRSVCMQLGLKRTSFDILLFLANHSQHNTLSSIVRIRHLPPSLVSIHVEELVQAGLLERYADPRDRRKTVLVLSEKSRPVVQQAQKVQQDFFEDLLAGISESEREVLEAAFSQIAANAAVIVQREKKK